MSAHVLLDEVRHTDTLWVGLDGLRAGMQLRQGAAVYRVTKVHLETMNPWQWRVLVEGARVE